MPIETSLSIIMPQTDVCSRGREGVGDHITKAVRHRLRSRNVEVASLKAHQEEVADYFVPFHLRNRRCVLVKEKKMKKKAIENRATFRIQD